MSKLKKYKVKFKGHFWSFVGWSFLGYLIALVSFGILLPAILFFQIKYIIENVEIIEFNEA